MQRERTGPKELSPPPATRGSAVPVAPPASDVLRDAEGRWRWAAAEGALADPLALSFRSREDAQADRVLRLSAPFDATGRRVLPKEHLRKLISAVAQTCPSCHDVFFGGVYWHPRDAQGCNWSVDVMNGEGDHRACRESVQAAKAELRRRYSILDEG